MFQKYFLHLTGNVLVKASSPTEGIVVFQGDGQPNMGLGFQWTEKHAQEWGKGDNFREISEEQAVKILTA